MTSQIQQNLSSMSIYDYDQSKYLKYTFKDLDAFKLELYCSNEKLI